MHIFWTVAELIIVGVSEAEYGVGERGQEVWSQLLGPQLTPELGQRLHTEQLEMVKLK